MQAVDEPLPLQRPTAHSPPLTAAGAIATAVDVRQGSMAAVAEGRAAQLTPPPPLIGDRQDVLLQLSEDEGLTRELNRSFRPGELAPGLAMADAGNGGLGAEFTPGADRANVCTATQSSTGFAADSANPFPGSSDVLGGGPSLEQNLWQNCGAGAASAAPHDLLSTGQGAHGVQAACWQAAAAEDDASLIDVRPSSDHDALASLFAPADQTTSSGTLQQAQPSPTAELAWQQASLLVKPQPHDSVGASHGGGGDFADFGLLAGAGDPGAATTCGVFF